VKTLVKPSGCKINLLLNILGRRPDGFHELETILQPVPLFDEIELSRNGSGIQLTTDHPSLPCDDSNLMVKAARAFFEVAGMAPAVTLRLAKRVPMEAGLGGGSANAATTLLGLNELFDSPLTAGQLHEAAARLGSDVPFFLQGNPALATGRGERIEPLAPFPALRGLTLLLVHPGFGISTAWAYRSLARFPDALNGRPGRAGELIRALNRSDSPDWGRLLYNSLEAPAFWKYPILGLYVEEFKSRGAVAAMMSGSGSTVFAWFANRALAESCLEHFRARFGSACWSATVEVTDAVTAA
jgi:4-diphosphocytidyl-2-C-methyl-D-erythritol kinase